MTDRPITTHPGVKASEGRMFMFGRTSVYVGPREPSPNGRNLKRPPVLAYTRLGVDEAPHIVAEFPNAASAEQFITALITGVDEMTEAAEALAAAMREAKTEVTVEPADGGTLDPGIGEPPAAGAGATQINITNVISDADTALTARRVASQLRAHS